MNIINYVSGITQTITTKTQPKSIPANVVGNALTNLAQLTKENVEAVATNVSEIQSKVFIEGIVPVNGIFHDNQFITNAGVQTSSTNFTCFEFIPQIEDVYYVDGSTINNSMSLVVYLSSTGSLISTQFIGTASVTTPYNKQLLKIPSNTAKVFVNSYRPSGVIPNAFHNGYVSNFYTKDGVWSKSESYSANQIDADFKEEYFVQELGTLNDGKFKGTGGAEFTGANWACYELTLTSDKIYYADGSTFNNAVALAVYYNVSNAFVGYEFIGVNGTVNIYSKQLLTPPPTSTKVFINTYKPSGVSPLIFTKEKRVKYLSKTEAYSKTEVLDRAPLKSGFGTDIMNVELYGQSNMGAGVTDSVVTVGSKYDNLMPKGGLFAGLGGDFTAFIPLAEATAETPASGIFNRLVGLIESNSRVNYKKKGFQFVTCLSNQGGVNIAGLSIGTAPFTKLTTQVTKMKKTAELQGKSYSVPFLIFVHGEQDVIGNTSLAVYKAALIKLFSTDYTSFISTLIPEQKVKPVCILTQVNFTNPASKDLVGVAKAQLELGKYNSDFILSAPTYMCDYIIQSPYNIHWTPKFRNIMGEYIGIASYLALINGGSKFLPLHVTGFNYDSTTSVLTVNYYVPYGSLILDTTLVPNPGDYGFKLRTSGNVDITLSNIKVVGESVKIQCSTNPSGGSFYYARRMSSGQFSNPDGTTVKLEDRGCLRDSQGLLYQCGDYPLHNWAVAETETLPIF